MAVDSSPILVVANPAEGDAIRDLLSDAGFDNIGLVDGGEETVTTFDEVRPHVVVVAVGLPKGDAKQLIAAMRARDERRPMRVVLIGEEDGPIRNALDATDFAVDRFVGRPLSTKALAFAVTSCAKVVKQERDVEPVFIPRFRAAAAPIKFLSLVMREAQPAAVVDGTTASLVVAMSSRRATKASGLSKGWPSTSVSSSVSTTR